MAYLQVAIGVIVRDGRVLLTRRVKGDRFEGLWEFPGGKLETGESAQACVVREVSEEVGLEVEVMARLAPMSHDYGDLQVTLHPFIVVVTSGVERTPAGSEMRWASLREMDALQFPAASVPLLGQLEHILKHLALL